MLTDIYKNKWNISTHSLTKRLTDDGIPILYAGLYFNSQPHEEADGTERMREILFKAFQLTASRRG